MYLNAFMDSAGTFSESGFENLAENASFRVRLLYGLKICGIGMLIVFAVLIALWLVLYLFKLYYNMNQKKKTNAQTEASAAVPVEEVVSTASVASPANEDEQTIVAIATAAISASRNVRDAAFKVLSIRKIN